MAARHSNTAATVTAVAYYRMSSDKQEASIPAQREAVETYADQQGYRIIREYLDEGISGDATEKRRGFQRMIGEAADGDFQAILVWDQDRFGRFDSVEAGHWIYPLRKAGVCLVTVAQGRIDWNDFVAKFREFLQSIIEKVVVQVTKHKHGRRHRYELLGGEIHLQLFSLTCPPGSTTSRTTAVRTM